MNHILEFIFYINQFTFNFNILFGFIEEIEKKWFFSLLFFYSSFPIVVLLLIRYFLILFSYYLFHHSSIYVDIYIYKIKFNRMNMLLLLSLSSLLSIKQIVTLLRNIFNYSCQCKRLKRTFPIFCFGFFCLAT